MSEGEVPVVPFPIEMTPDKTAEIRRFGEDMEILAPKDSTAISPVAGILSILKGREDLGEDPNVTKGVTISFGDNEGRKYQVSITSARGIDITGELQSRISAQSEKPDIGVEVKRLEPIFKVSGDNQSILFYKTPQDPQS